MAVETAETPAIRYTNGIATRFTPERAKEMAILRAKYRAERQAMAEAKSKLAETAPELTDYLKDRLLRVRKQLDRIDDLLLSEDDPSKLDRLAAASMRLAEQERILAGRPLPGSLKPSAAKSRRQPQSFAPIESDSPQ